MNDGSAGLDGALDRLDALFSAAQETEAYSAVHAEALQFSHRNHGVAAFRAAVIAADSAYWAAQAGDKSQLDAKLLGLVDELAGLPYQPSEILSMAPPGLMERFVSLVDAVVRLTVKKPAEKWSEFARLIEQSVPVDFRFSPELSGVDWKRHTVKAAGSLAAASMLHGDAEIGEGRCRSALQLFLDSGDVLDYCHFSGQVYGWAKECWAERPELVVTIASLQTVILGHVDKLRSKYRSRTGRLWVAQIFDAMLAGFQRDMAEPLLPAISEENAAAAAPFFEYLRDRLFQAVECGKSRLLLDQVTSGTAPFAEAERAVEAGTQERALLALTPNVTSDHAMVRREIQLSSRLPMMTWLRISATPSAPREAVRVQEQVDNLEALFGDGEGLLGTERPAMLEAVKEELGQGEVIVEYAIPRDTLHPAPCIYALIITKSSLQHTVIPLEILMRPPFFHGTIGALKFGDGEPVDESPLGELVVQTRIAIQRGDTERTALLLRMLHGLLIEPLMDMGLKPEEIDHLHLIPHSILHAIPFGALRDPAGSYLIEKTALSVAPSASVWLQLRQAWTQKMSSFTGIGNPQLDPARWRSLPNTADEVRSASEKLSPLPCKLLLNKDANLVEASRNAPGSSILHVASHGDFPESNAIDMHQILLTPGEADDGRLTAELVRRWNLRKMGLAVLSVCGGGLHRVGPGDELYGLVPAFLEAGAANVLTTLWSVDDTMAKLWMREFYKTVARAGPAKASKAACQAFIADGAAVRDWAAFVAIGGN
jgi:CHAT domain-containing protein